MANLDLEQTATDLANAIARGVVSSEEVTSTYLDRIEAQNGRLNAFVTFSRNLALKQARSIDAARKKGGVLAPFAGVPTGIKDLNFARGFPTRFGSAAARSGKLAIPFDDRLTQQMRAAGFVIVGKLATSEVGALPVTEPTIHPPTITPWSKTPHSAGGSSGGSGAAVAGRLLPIAPGSDGAGSVRIPACFNGLVGIKPSRGRVRNAYGLDDQTLLYSDGPLARSVHDAAALLDSLAGFSSGKRSWAPTPRGRFTDALRHSRKLRIAVSFEHKLAATDPEVAAAVERVAALCSQLGHTVETKPWLDIEVDEFLPIWQRAVSLSKMMVKVEGTQPPVRWLKSTGASITKQAAEDRKRDLIDRTLQWFGDYDIRLSPTVMQTAPPVGAVQGSDGEQMFRSIAPIGGFTAPFNLSGQPALSLPVGLSKTGLPIGVQIAGKLFAEEDVLALAFALEQHVGKMPAPASLAG